MNPTDEQIRAVNSALRPVLDAFDAKLEAHSKTLEEENVAGKTASEFSLEAELASLEEVLDQLSQQLSLHGRCSENG